MQKEEIPNFHFYNFCFLVQKAGVQQFMSAPMQLTNMAITLPVLAGVRKSLQLPEDAILISATYMGYMTLEAFAPPARAGMQATQEYLDGLQAAQQVSPVNPYPVGTVQYKDWHNGLLQGMEILNKSNALEAIVTGNESTLE